MKASRIVFEEKQRTAYEKAENWGRIESITHALVSAVRHQDSKTARIYINEILEKLEVM